MFIAFVLLAAGGVGLWGFSVQWGEPVGLLYAMPLFLLAAWSIAESFESSAEKSVDAPATESRQSNGLQTWFSISCAVALATGIIVVGLVGSALHWDWV